MFFFNVVLFSVLGIFILACYKLNHVFRCYTKAVIIGVYTSCTSLLTIMICICTFRRRNVTNIIPACYMTRPVSRVCGINWIVRGKEYMEKDEACIIVANHQTALDTIGIHEFLPILGKCGLVAKKEVIYFFPHYALGWLSRTTYIDRSNLEESKATLQRTVDEFKTKRIKLLIFAEGHRRNTGEIHPLKKGAFHLAINAQIPICPIVYSRYYFLDETNKYFESGNIIITALPPISTQGMTSSDVNKLMEQTREAMIKVFNETSEEAVSM